jgi:glycosyltransferase involved in cell wall biosynthesis
MDISIVIPLFNEEESLPELMNWINEVCTTHNYSYEVIMVDDGSTDSSWNVIETLRQKYSSLKAIKFQRNYGKSGALHEGFKVAMGNVVFTMDADLQDSPDEIPDMYTMVMNQGYDIVSGWKKVRYDNTLTKNIPSKFYNWTARQASGIKLHDFNCGLKAYKNKVIKSIEVYGEMHRYIPVLAKWAGFKKIGEKVVEHRARKFGVTKFGMSRFINGPLDLLSIMFVGKFSKRPMHFFGKWGALMFLVGFSLSLYLIIAKLTNYNVISLTNKPQFYIAMVTMIIGVQLFLAGFLAELISRNSASRNDYLIEKQMGFNANN